MGLKQYLLQFSGEDTWKVHYVTMWADVRQDDKLKPGTIEFRNPITGELQLLVEDIDFVRVGDE